MYFIDSIIHNIHTTFLLHLLFLAGFMRIYVVGQLRIEIEITNINMSSLWSLGVGLGTIIPASTGHNNNKWRRHSNTHFLIVLHCSTTTRRSSPPLISCSSSSSSSSSNNHNSLPKQTSPQALASLSALFLYFTVCFSFNVMGCDWWYLFGFGFVIN